MKVFGEEDQNHFASLSGDVNPVHVDSAAARRTQAGATVAHGVHAVLWAIDSLAAQGFIASPIAAISARFQRFIYVGTPVELTVLRITDNGLRAAVQLQGVAAVTIDITYGSAAEPEAQTSGSPPVALSEPLNLDIADMPGRSGLLPTIDVHGGLAKAFPNAVEALGARRVKAIASVSTLVGMACPGLHSMLSGFEIRTTGDAGTERGLSFEVTGVDDRFRLVEMAVAGDGIAGTVSAFVRHAPVAQKTMREIRTLVRSGEFTSAKALVIGASRGLGAVTARVLAAGGAEVFITYVRGEAEARIVGEEIGADRGHVARFDALSEPNALMSDLPADLNQMYYFATPHIFRQRTGWWSEERFHEFCGIYVDGFAAVCKALQARGIAEVSVFYPSSAAVEERPRDLTEYAMAKAAGEMLCADMNRFAEGLRVLVKRLPRLLTDQTASIMPCEAGDAFEAMLPIVREMQSLAR